MSGKPISGPRISGQCLSKITGARLGLACKPLAKELSKGGSLVMKRLIEGGKVENVLLSTTQSAA
jgi:hypothetical protein